MPFRPALCSLLFCCGLPLLGGGIQAPRLSDVKPTLEEMFQIHIECNRLEPALLRRSLQLLLEQFDPEKIYLLQDEAEEFLSLSDKRSIEAVRAYNKGEFPLYAALYTVICRSIERARLWRGEIEREFVVREEGGSPAYGQSYAEFALDPAELKGRLKQHLHALCAFEQSQRTGIVWNLEMRQKLTRLIERKLARKEELYFPGGKMQEQALAVHMLKAVARSMDAHTAYYTPEEAFELRTLLEKQFEGLGLVLREGLDGVEISDLVPSGPAAESRQIERGDRLLKVNGIDVSAVGYDRVLDLLQDGGKQVRLLLMREGSSRPHEVQLTRRKIVLKEERVQVSAIPFADGVLGVITLPSFYESSGLSAEADLKQALRMLRKSGKLYGCLLDMRENSGGFLGQAVKVAGLFISCGVVVVSEYAHNEVHYLRQLDGRQFYDGPLLLLTSRISASAAEIVAQALQDYGVALVAGDESTYGKGSIQYQTVTDSKASRFYKVTVGRYYTVSGRSTQIEGVQADLQLPTQYAPLRLGERYLLHPLPAGKRDPVYQDPLRDVSGPEQRWLERNYLPRLQQQVMSWRALLPPLRANSQQRLVQDKNYQAFLASIGLEPSKNKNLEFGSNDLQQEHGLEILRDMALLAP